MNMTRTKSTESPRIEAACFRHVLPATAETQNMTTQETLENQGKDGGRGKDRTCDPSRVKGGQALEIPSRSQESADSPTAAIEALKAWVAPQTNQAIVSTTLILIRSLNPNRSASLAQIAENTAHWEAAVRAGR